MTNTHAWSIAVGDSSKTSQQTKKSREKTAQVWDKWSHVCCHSSSVLSFFATAHPPVPMGIRLREERKERERERERERCREWMQSSVCRSFDRVHYDTLLSIVANAGAKHSALDWFQSYLSGRTICTSALDALSPAGPVTSGVPQGSVLGPLLFVSYFKDIPTSNDAQSALLADDTMLYRKDCLGGKDTLRCPLQTDLIALLRWADDFHVLNNGSKSAELPFDLKLQLNSPWPVTPCKIWYSGHVQTYSPWCYSGLQSSLGWPHQSFWRKGCWLSSPVQNYCFPSQHAWNGHSSLLYSIYSTTHWVLQCSVVWCITCLAEGSGESAASNCKRKHLESNFAGHVNASTGSSPHVVVAKARSLPWPSLAALYWVWPSCTTGFTGALCTATVHSLTSLLSLS